MKTREIKFRAWNPAFKQMMDCDSLILNGLYVAPSGVGIVAVNHDLQQQKNIILMQFTGLLDKNGKDIYEGDILLREEIKYRIDFSNGAFCATEIHQPPAMLARWVFNETEIIGNIYENSDLLK